MTGGPPGPAFTGVLLAGPLDGHVVTLLPGKDVVVLSGSPSQPAERYAVTDQHDRAGRTVLRWCPPDPIP